MVSKDTWVSLRRLVLPPEARAAGIPADTAETPLTLWVKGELLHDAEVGWEVAVRTRTGRIERGTLEGARPQYTLGYGDFIPELQSIGQQAREILFGGEKDA